MTARAPSSPRGLLARLGGLFHGYASGPAALEHADAELRERVIAELQATHDWLDRLIVKLSSRGVLAYLADLEHLKRQLAGCAGALRLASGAECGPDRAAVRAELDRLYRIDLRLRASSRAAAASVRTLSARSWAADIASVRGHVETLERGVAERLACGVAVGSSTR